MSKITFRADDELIERLEEFDASKSEVMRKALRQFLDESGDSRADSGAAAVTESDGDGSIDKLIAERVDTIIADRLDGRFRQPQPRQPQDVNVNITLDGDSTDAAAVDVDESKTDVDDDADSSDIGDDECKTCQQCGEELSSEHVYCPNCGEKAARRVFCECGDELRSDWAFCPGCGRRTTAADVLDGP